MTKKEFITGGLTTLAVAAGLNLMLFYGIDGEVARQEREVYGHEVSACLFDSNCHNYQPQPQKGEEKWMMLSSKRNSEKLTLMSSN